MHRKKVVIFGGGVAGLTVAHELAERGNFDITLYEKDKCLGGKTKSVLTKEGYPGEHSIRTISCPYYQFRDTLSRIPTENNKTVLDNVLLPITGSRKFLAFKDHNVCVLPSYFPYTPAGFWELLKFFRDMGKIVPFSEIVSFAMKLLKSGVMCSDHRLAVMEKISWDDYLGTKNKSAAFINYFGRMPEFYIAARGNASARSMAMMIEKALFLPIIHPIKSHYSSHDMFSGSTNTSFIEPMEKYLKKLGVTIQTNTKLIKVKVGKNKKIENVIALHNGKEETIDADVFVFAIQLEAMRDLVDHNPELKEHAPSVGNLHKLHSEETSGIQFYVEANPNDSLPRGWTAYMDSPWSIVGIYLNHPDLNLKAPVTGVLSLAWSNFDKPGVLYNKPARECTEEEIKQEILAQVSMHKGSKHIKSMKLHGYHMDYAIQFGPNNGPMNKHTSALFIQLPGTYQYQPSATTEIDNMFLASDYVRTTYDSATMEAANEAGRRAVNGILNYTQDKSKRCFVKKKVTTGFGFLQLFDWITFKIKSSFKITNPNH